jgi:chromosome partitioning protein
MSVPVIAFFNNKGGVGKTSLVYHLAWMFSDLGTHVVAADLDPQANLTSACLDEDLIESIWMDRLSPQTAYNCVEPIVRGFGDIDVRLPHAFIADRFGLLPGDLLLSAFEDELSSQWQAALDGNERAFYVLSAFSRIVQQVATDCEAELILLDLGPNLGSINRAALIAADYVVVPLSPDLYSLRAMRNLGSTLAEWRDEWNDRLRRKPKMDIELPAGGMEPLGYIVLQRSVRLDRPNDKWINRIPGDYRKYVLSEPSDDSVTIQNDPHKLALLKHYPSLMTMAQEARKPMFHLKPADGAIGSHFQSAQEAYRDFKALAGVIRERAHLPPLRFA